MKKKISLWTLIAAMVFSFCGFACAAFAGTGSAQKQYLSGGFHASELESTVEGKNYVRISKAASAFLVLNREVGGSAVKLSRTLTVDMTVTGNLSSFLIGLLPTNDPADVAEANIAAETHSIPNSDYMFYIDSTTIFMMKDNAWGANGTPAYTKAITGRVTFKFETTQYGAGILSMIVPASNTAMDCEKDAPIVLAGNENAGFWGDYLTDPGYYFIKTASDVTLNKVSVSDGFTENFTDSAVFNTNWVVNDAFENAVTLGTANKPQPSPVGFSETVKNTAGIKGSATAGTDVGSNMIVSNKTVSGAMRIEVLMDTTAVTGAFGFTDGSGAVNNYLKFDTNGYGYFKNKVYAGGDYATNWWPGILKETGAAYYEKAFGGQMKFIVDISADGTAKISLRIISQTLGSGLKTDADYVLETKSYLFDADISEGSRFFVSVPASQWAHANTLKSVSVRQPNGTVLLEDDFKLNHINGKGLCKWETEASSLTLPNTGTARINAAGALGIKETVSLTDADMISGTFNFKLTAGTLGFGFGLGAGYAVGNDSLTLTFAQAGANAVVTCRRGTAAGTAETFENVNLSKDTLVNFKRISKSGELTLTVGGKTKVFQTAGSVNGKMAFFGTADSRAELNYASVFSGTVSAPSLTLPEMEAGDCGKGYDLSAGVSDANFDASDVTVAVTATKDGTAFDMTGMSIGDFKAAAAGTYVFTYTATNPAGISANASLTVEFGYAAPKIDLSKIPAYYNGIKEIVFAPKVTDLMDEAENLTVKVEIFKGKTAEGTPVMPGTEILKFTPTEISWYTAVFTAENSNGKTVSESMTFRVYSLGQQSDASTKFETDPTAFDKAGTTFANGSLTFGENSRLGTKGWAKNFVHTVRFTGFTEEATEFTLYFGKLGAGDSAGEYARLVFTKDSTKAKLYDASGKVKEIELGVDVFAVSDKGLTVQLTVFAGKAKLALLYGDLPYEVLQTPVAEFDVAVNAAGTLGIESAAGGFTVDRFVFVNLSGYAEIPDDVVPPDPPAPEPGGDDDDDKDPASCGGCGSTGFGGTLGGGMLIALLGWSVLKFRKQKIS